MSRSIWLSFVLLISFSCLVICQDRCAAVSCLAVNEDDCPESSCGLVWDDQFGCCQSCCDGPCVECLVNPCDNYVCGDNPEYTCEANYCGGCNREWYDTKGNYQFCENELIEEQISPCATVLCAVPPEESECECGLVWDENGCCQSCCDEPCVECLVNPCDNYTCGDNPEFTCEPNYCGGCNREWYDENGRYQICENEIGEISSPCATVLCAVPPEESECECGLVWDETGCCQSCCDKPCVRCLANPCDNYVCDDNPEFTCEANYCGGCNREWYDENGNYQICSSEREALPVDCSLVLCAPVDEEECLCGTVWDESGCCQSCCQEACASCLVDPCENYTCGDNPELTCQANYCGGCNREWYDENGRYQICENEIIPPPSPCELVRCAGVTEEDCDGCGLVWDENGCCQSCCDEPCVECFVNPCDNYICDRHPEYTCEANYCGGCNREWYDENGLYQICESELFAQENPCAYVDCDQEPICEEGCGYSYVEDSCCPTCCDEPCVNCFVDPCEFYICGDDPSYTCRSNYCGGCNREWFDENGMHRICRNEAIQTVEDICNLVDCMPVPEESDCGCGLVWDENGCCQSCCDEPCVRCLTNPCENYICDDNPEFTCQANYCGGCNREWYDAEGKYQICSSERETLPVDCSVVLCAPVDEELCECQALYDESACCQSCCTEPCVQCFVNPCDNYTCGDNPELTCQANYCGGCNREWVDEYGQHQMCLDEIFGAEEESSTSSSSDVRNNTPFSPSSKSFSKDTFILAGRSPSSDREKMQIFEEDAWLNGASNIYFSALLLLLCLFLF